MDPASSSQGDLFFSPWEQEVHKWTHAQTWINRIIGWSTETRELAWRGVVDASWSLHSSLYRHIQSSVGKAPDEADFLEYETEILRRCRSLWRYDKSEMSALELLAHIQHYGGPTRLLDVTFNPLIALWFAVEQKHDGNGVSIADVDGRLFAFDVTGQHITMDSRWGNRALPWSPQPVGWRDKRPNVWRPPSFNDRIPAQNSAFLVGGIPLPSSGSNGTYRKAPGQANVVGWWTSDEVRQSTSVAVKMNALTHRPQVRSQPTFTLRISAAHKPEIRTILERSFGYNSATMFPDLYGLAQNVGNNISI